MALGIAVTRATASDPLYSFRATSTNIRMGPVKADEPRSTGNFSQTAIGSLGDGSSKSKLNITAEDVDIYHSDMKNAFLNIGNKDLESN